tara:strand:+ start:6607 stop:9051 length:2445 start_codon:yes stop_codon:yes gene_type:complete
MLNKLKRVKIIKTKTLIFLILIFSKNLFANNYFNWEEVFIQNNDLKIENLNNSFFGTHHNTVILSNGLKNQHIYYTNDQKFWNVKKNSIPSNIIKVSSISTKNGLFCIGIIKHEKNLILKSFLIKKYNNSIIIDWKIANPNFTSSNVQILEINNDIYAFVQNPEKLIYNLWKLNFSKNIWEKINSFSFNSKNNFLIASQSNGVKKLIFLFDEKKLIENYKYDLESQELNSISMIKFNSKFNFYNSSIIPIGSNQLTIFSNNRTIFSYNTVTDTWIKSDKVPFQNFNNSKIIKINENLFFLNNSFEKKNNINTWLATPIKRTDFGTIDYIVLGLYLTLIIYIGFHISRKKSSINDFFRANKNIPWWAAGLSIFATQLSAITFMAIPAKSYSGNWTWVILNFTIILIAPIISYFIIPLYSRLDITTAYQYLEKRFNILVRLVSSAMFVVFQLVRLGTLLYLPSIALSAASGININLCIILMGFLAITYTVLGGIEAVIWTDVIQVFVLLGGAILALFIIQFHLDNGIQDIISIGFKDEKFKVFNFHFNFKSPTFWVLCLGGIGSNIISYGSDQSVIQRYLTTKNKKEAQKSIITNAYLTIPSTLIFFSLGTSLYSFYKIYPNRINIHLENIDGILPWFISTSLPQGISGLLIAGIFAATMSSLDSGMNSVSAVVTTDFFNRFKKGLTEKSSLLIARITTIVTGLFGISFALSMSTWNIDSLWTEFTKYIGLFGGGLGGLFLLAIFTRRSNSYGVIIGLFLSALIQYFLTFNNFIHPLMFAFTGMFSCVFFGYLFSIIIEPNFKIEKKYTCYYNKSG